MSWKEILKGKGERHFYIENGKPVQWIGETHKHPDGTLMSGKEHKEGVSKKLLHFYELDKEHLKHLSKETTVIKAPSLTPEEEKEVQDLMRFRNLSREEAEKKVRRKAGKTARAKLAVGRFIKSD